MNVLSNKEQLELTVFLENLNEFIDLISKKFLTEPDNFTIMGGFARRMYMLKNGIPFESSDFDEVMKCDVDIFCNIRDIFQDGIIDDIDAFNDGDYNKLEYLIDHWGNRHESKIDTLREILLEKFYHHISGFTQEFKEIYHETRDDGRYPYYEHVFIDENETISTDRCTKYQIGKVYDRLGGISGNRYHEIMVSTGTNSMMTSHCPSLSVSMVNGSVTYPIAPNIQLVCGNRSNTDTINGFDMEQAKFKMTYPFDINTVEKVGTVDDDAMYMVTSMELKSVSPFRIIDRLVKYSNYGFQFSGDIVDKVNEYADEFVDNNDVSRLPTYVSSLY